MAAGPVVLVTSIQRTYHNRTTKQHTYLLNTEQATTSLHMSDGLASDGLASDGLVSDGLVMLVITEAAAAAAVF